MENTLGMNNALGMPVEAINALNNSKLQTLLNDRHLHVFIADNIKIVFSKGQNVGFILGDTLYMQPQYAEGGQFNNFFVDMEMKMVVNTYKIREVTTWQQVEQSAKVGQDLAEMLKELEQEKDLQLAELIFLKAKDIIKTINHPDAQKTLNADFEKAFSSKLEKPVTPIEKKLIEETTPPPPAPVNSTEENKNAGGEPVPVTHTVKKDETLVKISRKYKLTVRQLRELNDLPVGEVKKGQILIVE